MKPKTPTIENKKARFDYEIIETIEAGLVLTGSEVKSLREGKASIQDAYVRFIKGEPYLIKATVNPYPQANIQNHEPERKRKLLLHKREIKKLLGKVKERGFTIIPLKLYFNKRGYAKVLIGLAKGKTKHDKREQIRRRDMDRQLARELKHR